MDIIKYQGHGMIERATHATSVGHVMLHEKRHILDYEKRAMMRGEKIISKDVDIDYAFIDGKLVAVGGEASATFRKEEEITYSVKSPRVVPPEKEEEPEVKKEQSPEELTSQSKEDKNQEIEQLEQQEKALRNQKTQLQNKLRSIDHNQEIEFTQELNTNEANFTEILAAGGEGNKEEKVVSNTSEESKEIEEKINKIEQELRSIEAKKAIAKQGNSERANINSEGLISPAFAISLNTPTYNSGALIDISV